MKGGISPACLSVPSKAIPSFSSLLTPSHTEQLYLSLCGMEWDRQLAQRDSPAAPKHTFSVPMPPSKLQPSWLQLGNTPWMTGKAFAKPDRFPGLGWGGRVVQWCFKLWWQYSDMPGVLWDKAAVKTRGLEMPRAGSNSSTCYFNTVLYYCCVTY